MKNLFSLLVILSIAFQAKSQLQLDSINNFNEGLSEEVSKLTVRESKMSSFFTGLYDIIEIKDELKYLSSDINEIKSKLYNNDNSNLENLITEAKITLDKIELVYSAFEGFNYNQELLSEDYFDLWNVVFQKKIIVDKLFMKVNIHSSSYAGQNESEFVEIKKKGIYHPCQKLYDHYLLLIRNVNQCDYAKRINILKKTQTLLFKMEDLAKTRNTREVEKVLKKITRVEDIEQYITEL